MTRDPSPRQSVAELRQTAMTVAALRRAFLGFDPAYPISHLELVSPDEPNGAGLPPAGADLAEHPDDERNAP